MGEQMYRTNTRGKLIFLAAVLTGGMSYLAASAQSSPGKPEVAVPGGGEVSIRSTCPEQWAKSDTPKAREYYTLRWGVESTGNVRSTESGEIIRFAYRVLDPEKARPLNDKKNEPSLVDPKAGVKLVIPSLEKVGKLRQSSPPEPGKVYWMGFRTRVEWSSAVTV